MPMRRISSSLPRVGFADDASPLSEGLANAAATLGELWPRLNQIEADKQQTAAQQQEREQDRQLTREDRESAAADRRQLWDTNRQDRQEDQAARRTDQETQRANQRSLWEAEHGAYQGDDPALTTVSGQNATLINQKLTPKSDTTLDWNSAWKQAKDEIGSPEGDKKIVMVPDRDGVKHPQLMEQPLNEYERHKRVGNLNWRARELSGHPVQALPVPDESQNPGSADPSSPLWQPGAQREQQAQQPQKPDPAQVFTQLSGLNPAPEFIPHLLGQDPEARAAVIRSMAPQERLKAIAALKQMGFQ